MERYDKYKDSGIAWLGEIPEHWGVSKAKWMFVKNKRERRPEDEVITCFRDGQVTLRKNRRLTGFTESEKYDGYQGVRKGDLVIHQMDAFAGSIGVSDSDGMATSVLHCCTPIGNENVYYYAYLLRHMAKTGYIQSLYKGIRERSSDFSFPIFRDQLLAVPPIDEQEKIVEYIESKTLTIDSYVRERERELRLLNELKQTEIAQAVTQGLNPNVPMKDSGIPWVGMIPTHWEMRRIKYILSEQKERSVTGAEILLSLTKENGLIPSSEKKNKTMESDSLVGYKVIRKGEIVFNRFKARLFARSNYDGLVSPDYAVYQCHDVADADYMVTLLNTPMYREAFNRKASGIGDGFSRLYTDELFSFYSIFPPKSEQQEIVHFIDEKCNNVNGLIAELESEITYLKEYKQRMIADAVTGKMKVC